MVPTTLGQSRLVVGFLFSSQFLLSKDLMCLKNVTINFLQFFYKSSVNPPFSYLNERKR